MKETTYAVKNDTLYVLTENLQYGVFLFVPLMKGQPDFQCRFGDTEEGAIKEAEKQGEATIHKVSSYEDLCSLIKEVSEMQ